MRRCLPPNRKQQPWLPSRPVAALGYLLHHAYTFAGGLIRSPALSLPAAIGQWHDPLPLSLKLSPAMGMNCQV